eukprot:611297-Rhodomonas_salina.2
MAQDHDAVCEHNRTRLYCNECGSPRSVICELALQIFIGRANQEVQREHQVSMVEAFKLVSDLNLWSYCSPSTATVSPDHWHCPRPGFSTATLTMAGHLLSSTQSTAHSTNLNTTKLQCSYELIQNHSC